MLGHRSQARILPHLSSTTYTEVWQAVESHLLPAIASLADFLITAVLRASASNATRLQDVQLCANMLLKKEGRDGRKHRSGSLMQETGTTLGVVSTGNAWVGERAMPVRFGYNQKVEGKVEGWNSGIAYVVNKPTASYQGCP